MTSFVKSVEPADYAEIVDGVEAVKHTVRVLSNMGAHIEIAHPHRLWEYGSAIAALISVYEEQLNEIRVLDVGAGNGALGPTLSYTYDIQVLEEDPDKASKYNRNVCNDILRRVGKKPIVRDSKSLFGLPNMKFDAVFAISLLEHIDPEFERSAWIDLADHVKPGGLLFITVDCVPVADARYESSDRVNHYDVGMLADRIQALSEVRKMIPMGQPDFTYHGSYVHDYTYYRIGMIKEQETPVDISQSLEAEHRSKLNA